MSFPLRLFRIGRSACAFRLPALLLIALLLWSCSSRPPGQEEAVGGAVFSASITPGTPTAGSDVSAIVRGEVDEASYRWTVNGQMLHGETAERLAPENFFKGDRVGVTVVSGGVERSAEVVIRNGPPVVRSVLLSPEPLRAGTDVTALPDGRDIDGDPVRYTYRWFVNGEEQFAFDRPVLPGSLFRKGDTVSLLVVPDDGEDRGEAFDTGEITIPNGAPLFTSTPPLSFASRVYSYRATAVDPDGDAVRYTLKKAPDGMRIDGEGVLTWALPDGIRGIHTVSILADDGSGETAEQSYEISFER